MVYGTAGSHGGLARDDARDPALLDVLHLVDELIEQALIQKMSLHRALEHVCPKVMQHLGATAAYVHTYDEDLKLSTFAIPGSAKHRAFEDYIEKNAREPIAQDLVTDLMVARPLDVAGEPFGYAAFIFDGKELVRQSFLAEALHIFCEQIDNFLFGIRATREKQQITLALGHALENKVLGQGIVEAVGILATHVAIDKLLVILSTDEIDGSALHLQYFEGTTKKVDTLTQDGAGQLQSLARSYLNGDAAQIAAHFGFSGQREELLIHGVMETRLVGKIMVAPKHGDFNTYDRDLLTYFAEYTCQRIVDFHREYRVLARSFRPVDVDRMLTSADYRKRYLEPREQPVAMLYADISGFTRISEQILREPVKIGQLIDIWGGAAVARIWAHGGVFDKMVGDCVIGLFGPPFFERSPAESIAAAISAAKDIRAMTEKLPERPEFKLLAAEGVSVSIGVNFGPLFVGTFGPNDNFTGFSSGMNNAARLQGQAARGEILVMEDTIKALGETAAFAFGEARSAKVKNVADPLNFRALL